MTAIDYSFEKPTVSQLLAAGVTDVFRYVGPPGWGKTITQVEYNSLVQVGIRVWCVFEATANDSAGGYNAGVTNAKVALQYQPSGYTGPIFMACDEDLRGTALTTAVQYIEGASTILGVHRTGDYGPGALCQATHDAGFATYHWQSASTSFNGNGHTLPITHVQQGLGGPIAGTDADTILLPLTPPVPNPVPPGFLAPDLELIMSLASSPADALNVFIRNAWATYRTDTLSVLGLEYLQAGYYGPWKGSLDFVLACIIDTATTQGHLRPMFAGAA